ncbi:MAG: hypothetical protein ACT4PI_00720 [Actinomycetota bacterium]
MLFASRFEDGVVVEPPEVVNGTWRFPITGCDAGFCWEDDLPGSRTAAFFPLLPGSHPIDGVVETRIDTVTGPAGADTRAAYQEVTTDARGDPDAGRVRNQLPVFWTDDQGYAAYDLLLQPDLRDVMPTGEGSWRYLVEWREAGDGYRMWLGLRRRPTGDLFWEIQAQRDPPGGPTDWAFENHTVPVPVGEWARLEVYWDLDPVDGRLWVGVNGQTLFDHHGRTRLEAPLAAVHLLKVYTGANSLAHGPAYQWVDNIEMRNGPPDKRS